MKEPVKTTLFRIVDLVSVPFSMAFLPVLRFIRKHGVHRFPLNKKSFLSAGVFPVRDHFYEPQLRYSSDFDAQRIRKLAIDLDLPRQLQTLAALEYIDELKNLQTIQDNGPGFYVNNGYFGAGDCDLYYLLLRNTKPRRVIEIGSGFSTLLALQALQRNGEDGHPATLTCIDPHPQPWIIQQAGIGLIKQQVEKLPLETFDTLQDGDVLFIDSSHIIRPENDVLYEYLELLPSLRKGVILHIHDIFTPRHYRKEWLQDEFRFWNEQYLLEAFLYYNDSFGILYSLNHLKNDAFEKTKQVLRHLTPQDEPSSFWLRKMK